MPGLLEALGFHSPRRCDGREGAPLQKLNSEQSKLHLVGGARMLRVVLEAGALEPLHYVLLAVYGIGLMPLAANGIAEQRKATVVLPVRLEPQRASEASR